MTRSLVDRRDAVGTNAVPRLTPLEVASASGSWLTLIDGRRVLDMATGIGVMALGHGHPAIVEAVRDQVGKLAHVCAHVATYGPYVEMCERLTTLVPHGPRTRVMLANSGAEAVENAIKIARQATRRPAVICFTEAFHGRSMMAMTLTSKIATKQGCGPFAPEVYRLPYPNLRRYGDGLDEQAFVARELARLEAAFVHTVSPDALAAIVVEVIQGEGGFAVCPPDWLRGVRRICDEYGVLLVCDEVQSGLGRTGRWAAYEHHGVVPDLSTWAKALGGGLPLSAVVGRAELLERCSLGTLGGTFGGNPVSCAAGLAFLRAVEDEGVLARATAVGETIRARLAGIVERFPGVALHHRGLGAMQAIELDHGTRVQRVIARALARDVLFIAAGPRGRVVRLLSPLNISQPDLELALDVLAGAIAEES